MAAHPPDTTAMHTITETRKVEIITIAPSSNATVLMRITPNGEPTGAGVYLTLPQARRALTALAEAIDEVATYAEEREAARAATPNRESR